MKIFSKRETISQNMALMAIMAAINIILAIISALVPIASIFLMLIFPLISVLVELFCKDRYYPIYAFATIGLSLVATLWNMETTIFYLIPSILTGYLFGLLAKKRIPAIYSILGASLIQMGLSLAFIPLINFIFEVDIIYTFKSFFHLTESKNIDVIVPSFVFVTSMIQIVLSYIIIANEIKKVGFLPIADEKYSWIYQCILFGICLLSIGLSFVTLEVSYVLLMIAIYFSCFIVGDFIKMKSIYALIIFGAGLLGNVIIFGVYYSSMPVTSGLMLLLFTPLWIAFISTLVSFLKRKPKDIE